MGKPKTKPPTPWIDVSLHSVITGCSCGWRSDVETSRKAAWARIHTHYLAVHPGHSNYIIDRIRAHG